MSKVPRWLSLVLLPFAGAFDSVSYYTARAVLYQHLQQGVSMEQVSFAMTGAAFASLFGTILSGAVAAATGPWAMAIGGAGLLMLATVMLGVLPPEVGSVAVILLGFAHGMTRTALFGAAARAFPDFRTEGLRNATCFGIYGAANLAALFAAPMGGRVAEAVGTSSVFLSTTALGGLPLLAITIALGVVVWLNREKKDALTEPPTRSGNLHLIVSAVVLVVGGFVWMLWSSGFERVYELAEASSGGYSEHEGLMDLNPLVVTLGCALGFLVSVGLSVAKVRVPTLVPIGLGLLLISASLVVLVASDSADDALVTPAAALLAVGELIAAPLVLSRLMGDLHPRLPTLAVAVFYLLSTGPMLLLRAASSELHLTRALSGLGAASAGVAGVAFLVMGLLLVRRLFPDPEAPKAF